MSYSIYTNLIDQLIPNLPDHNGPPLEIDLVLDNGAFNGLYLFGVLVYLKVLESKNRIKIHRVSGSSIGACFGVLYLIDKLEIIDKIFLQLRDCWKEHCNLSNWKDILYKTTKSFNFEEYKDKINNKLFVNYFDTSTCKEHVVSEFDNVDELCETLFKSSFIPLIINGELTHNNCIDGFNPILFNERTEEDKKILFVHLFTPQRIIGSFNLKDDKNHAFRAIEGIYEVHKFFLGKKQTLCSYVNDWNTRQLLTYRIRQIFYYLVIYIIKILVILKLYIPDSFYQTPIWNLFSQIGEKFYRDFMLQMCF